MNTTVSFEIVKLLEKIGWKFPYTIEYLEELQGTNNYVESIPTIADVVMWIYEKHGIWIEIGYGLHASGFYFGVSTIENHEYINQKLISDVPPFSTPTEAYEAAIEYTLKNLIK